MQSLRSCATLGFICGLALLLSFSADAQTKAAVPKAPAPGKAGDKPAAKPEAEAKPEAAPEITERNQRGLGLVREAATEAVSFTDKRNGARVQAQAADLLWPYDQLTARELFDKAFDLAVAHYRETKDDNTERVTHSSSTRRPDMRMEVARLAARREAALGKRLTDRYIEEKQREVEARRAQAQTANSPDGQAARANNKMFGGQDPAAGELLQAAQALAETDPKVAFQLVQRAFANNVPQSAPSFLPQMAARDRKLTDEIYVGALNRLAANPEAHAGQLLLLSAYPFGENRVWVTDGEGTNSYGFGVPSGFQPDPQIINRFLATALAVLNKAAQLNPLQYPEQGPRVGAALFAARQLEPKVVQAQPAMLEEWGLLKNRLMALAADAMKNGVEQALGEIAREKNERQPGGNSQDRMKDLLDKADKSTNLAERDDLFMQAALQANREGDTDRALSVTDKISDLAYKRTVRSWINFDAANKAANEKRFDDARRFALEVDATDQRAYLFYQIANSALKEKDRARAVELLEEAGRAAMTADNTAEKVRALLGVANLYGTLDPVRGFDLASEAVKTINQVADYNPDRAQLVRAIAMRSGRGANTSVNSVEGFDLGKTLKVLARNDFERALSLAQSLDQKPLKYTTVLTLAATLFETKQVSQAQ